MFRFESAKKACVFLHIQIFILCRKNNEDVPSSCAVFNMENSLENSLQS